MIERKWLQMDETDKKKRIRSPNFPSISLPDAIQRVSQIYRDQRQYPSNRDTIAKSMGYRGLNGASSQTISALNKFGLLEGTGDSLRVSDLGQELALHRLGDPEFGEAVKIAAMEPTFYQELQSLYPSGLPRSDHALRATLIKRGFLETAIDGAIEAYRQTMALVAEVDASSASSRSDQVGQESVAHEPTNSSSGISHTNSSSGMRTISLPMSGSSWAELRGPFPVSKREWDQMIAILGAMEPALVLDDEQPSPVIP